MKACCYTYYQTQVRQVKRQWWFCSLTVAVAVVADSYGAAKEAGGPAEVAGAGVSDVVIATDCLLRWHGDWARSCAAHDTVSAVGLISHTGVSTWTHHVGA